LVLEVSEQALEYKKRFSLEFKEISGNNAHCCRSDDLLIRPIC
jgi:hypothetical protein